MRARAARLLRSLAARIDPPATVLVGPQVITSTGQLTVAEAEACYREWRRTCGERQAV